MTVLLLLLAAAPTAAEIHQAALVFDTHADTSVRFADEAFDAASEAGPHGHLDLKKVKAGNLGAEFFAVCVDADLYKPGQYAHRALVMIDAVLEQVRRHPAELLLCITADEIAAARAKQKLAVLLAVEGGHAIENDLSVLRTFHRLGVRYLTLAHFSTNEWADSSGDIDDKKVAHHDGLTPFGREVVAEMNRLGMIVDISHVSDKTFADALAVTKAPVLASHSSARALVDHVRNMSDDMLRAVAKNGGVVQVNFFSGFVDSKWLAAWKAGAPARKKADKAVEAKLAKATPEARSQALWELELAAAAAIPRPPLKSLLDHIDHVAKVAGVDHVGLGSDFDGIPSLPEGIDSVADLPKITAALLERGWSKEDLTKLLGGNTLRVLRDVERVAKETR